MPKPLLQPWPSTKMCWRQPAAQTVRLFSPNFPCNGPQRMLSGTVSDQLIAAVIFSESLRVYASAVEPHSTYDALRGDGVSPRSKIAPALMHIENMSLQSLSRPSRGVGVTDLREALEGRISMSNPALVNVAPSVSTLEHASVAHGENGVNRLMPVRSRPEKALRNPGEVRDVLNKLRIGKANGSTSLLKSSFPALQRPDAR